MIDLSDVHDFNAARFMLYWLVACVVAVLVAYIITPEHKHKWFKQRSTNGIFERRGLMGNLSLLGVPRSKEGFAITAGIFIGAGLIWAALVYVALPLIGYPV